MDNDVLLQIHLSLQQLQITQQQMLSRMDEDKVVREKIADRLETMEQRWTYLLGAAGPVGIMFFFALDYIKTKLGFTV